MYPTEIRLHRDRARLSVTWENGATASYPATLLRERARDADSVRAFVDGATASPPVDLTITAVELVGNYAVHLTFSDGHDRAIYPWPHLIDIDPANATQAVLDHKC
jgi:DUF971 family protein